MSPECKLRAANGNPGVECQREQCVFWREVTGDPNGCAIQALELLSRDDDIAAWLLALKLRLEGDA